MSENAPYVAVVVCSRCGQRRVGSVTRHPRWFLYEPEVVPKFTRRKTLQRRYLPNPVDPEERQKVFCRRCMGWLSFTAGELVAAAQRVPPGGHPAVVRAVPDPGPPT